ncbi:MAG: hypothetical protein WCI55_03240 [Armatimonadota bacterium]
MGITALLLATTVAPISITLSSSKVGYTSGDDVPFSAMAVNRSGRPIDLIPQTDSMHWGRKAPYAGLETLDPSTGKWEGLYMKGVGRCGNANPLKSEDFVTVKPSKTIDLLNGMAWSKYEVNEVLKTPGTYRIRFRYDTTQKFDSWLGGPLMPEEAKRITDALYPRFERTPKGSFVSNEITIKITQSPH